MRAHTGLLQLLSKEEVTLVHKIICIKNFTLNHGGQALTWFISCMKFQKPFGDLLGQVDQDLALVVTIISLQAVNLLDDLDKELNNYIMRCREWYGWHFPELSKIITDNLAFVRTVEVMGTRDNAKHVDLSDILPEEVEEKVKEAAEISMGTEISGEDILNIKHLCIQVVEIQEYRTQLYEYLKNRMIAIAPNLTILVGELVGARLISHAGSLMNLAKHPASTVQILGAEKALFKVSLHPGSFFLMMNYKRTLVRIL